MSVNLLEIFGLLPFNERSAVFILVSLYVHQTSTCGLGLCPSEEQKLSPNLESSIIILCFAIIASKYDWWPQKLIQTRIMVSLPVMMIYNSWIALILVNLVENFFLVPLQRFAGMIADLIALGVIKITGEEDSSELSEKIGCMLLWLFSLLFLIYTLTNDGGIRQFVDDLKRYLKERKESANFKALASDCLSNFEESDQYEEPRRQIRQRRRKKSESHCPRRC